MKSMCTHVAFAVLFAAFAAGRADAQELAPGAPRVEFKANSPNVVLFEDHGDIELDRPLCRAPCDRVIDASDGRIFYFGGLDLLPSKRFYLADRTGDVHFKVTARSALLRTGGVVMLALGGSFAVLGLGSLSFGDNLDPQAGTRYPVMLCGGILTAVGLSLVAGGAVVFGLARTEYVENKLSSRLRGTLFLF
jgi:hypothetical protein